MKKIFREYVDPYFSKVPEIEYKEIYVLTHLFEKNPCYATRAGNFLPLKI